MLKFQNVWLIMSADTLFSTTNVIDKVARCINLSHILVQIFHFGSKDGKMQRIHVQAALLSESLRIVSPTLLITIHWISYRDDKEQGSSHYFRQECR
jgi:hypothetical protein